MAPNTAATRENILQSAQKEFLAHGFSGASMRVIAAGAGVTTGALYRHFEDKASLFDALVAPSVEAFVSMYEHAADKFMDQLNTSGLEWESPDQGLLEWVAYIYDHLDVFRLLLTAAEKTAYESFVHTMVEMEVATTMDYIERVKAKGYAMRPCTREEIHILVNTQFSAFFELVLHNIPRPVAMEYTKNISRFFTAGWRTFFSED